MTTESTDPHVLAPHRAAHLLRNAPWHRMAVLGDSILAGVGDQIPGYRPVYWAERVAEALRTDHDITYLNVAERDRRIDEIIEDQLPGVLAFNPDLVLVDGGGNDLFAADCDEDHVARRYEELVSRLSQSRATVVTFTTFGISRGVELPEPWGSRLLARYDRLQAHTRDVAQRHGTVFADFERHPMAGDPSIYSADLLHGNTKLHAIAASGAIEALGSHIAAKQQAAA